MFPYLGKRIENEIENKEKEANHLRRTERVQVLVGGVRGEAANVQIGFADRRRPVPSVVMVVMVMSAVVARSVTTTTTAHHITTPITTTTSQRPVSVVREKGRLALRGEAAIAVGGHAAAHYHSTATSITTAATGAIGDGGVGALTSTTGSTVITTTAN